MLISPARLIAITTSIELEAEDALFGTSGVAPTMRRWVSAECK